MDAATILDRCRMFARLAPSARARLAAMAEVQTVPARTLLLRAGDECPGIAIIGTGLVRVFKIAPSGKEHVLHLAGPGSLYAEAAVLGGFPAPAWAESVEATTIALLPSEPFRAFLRDDHQTCLDLLSGMSMWVHHVVGLLEDVVLRDAAGRVARHLLARVGAGGVVEWASTRKHLASHLNLTPETLSRTLRRMADESLITSERDQVTIINLAGLTAVAEGMAPQW